MQTAPLTRPALEEPAFPDPPPAPTARAADSLADPPPGFGRWPWWTPLVALASGLLLFAGPVALLASVHFTGKATLGEGLLGLTLLGISYALMARFGGRPRGPADLGLRATPSRAAVGWVIVARIAFIIFASIYINAVGGVTPNAPVRPIGGVGTAHAIDVVIAVVVLAPLFEELFFRGFMYAALRGRLPVLWASLICGSLFGAIHPLYGGAAWNLVPVLALGGVTMCLLYERTGSLWPAIAFHFVMNVGIVAILTGNVATPFYVIGGAALLFLVAPWRVFRRGAAA